MRLITGARTASIAVSWGVRGKEIKFSPCLREKVWVWAVTGRDRAENKKIKKRQRYGHGHILFIIPQQHLKEA